MRGGSVIYILNLSLVNTRILTLYKEIWNPWMIKIIERNALDLLS